MTVALVIGFRQIGHSPYRVGSTLSPFGCGRIISGGGISGLEGPAESAFAGDEGEYHHSRNLMKNIDMGNSTLSESKSSAGDERKSARSLWLSDVY
jgi:hypothetical protein